MRTNLTGMMLACCLVLITQTVQASWLTNIYEYTGAGMLSPATKNALFRVYVPNGHSGTVSVIDPTTYKVIDTFHTGKQPQHVVPAYDLQTLWVLNNNSYSATPINPATGKPGTALRLDDPYNLYFTPDGKYAIDVCEGRRQLQFRDPKTFKLDTILPVQCSGVNHMEFTTDGKYAIATCEHSGQLVKVDVANKKVVGYLTLSVTQQETVPVKVVREKHKTGHKKQSLQKPMMRTRTVVITPSMPQDIRSTADGSLFLVADMMQDGVILIDPVNFTKVGFIPTGIGTHGIYPSRDGKLFYVSNRGCHHSSCGPHGPGKISVVDPVTKTVVATWLIPNGGSPDMGNVTADGKELWLSGRYDSEVYVFDTTTGQLTHRIPVGSGPHGLAVWPQPGRYSLGHTGNMR